MTTSRIDQADRELMDDKQPRSGTQSTDPGAIKRAPDADSLPPWHNDAEDNRLADQGSGASQRTYHLLDKLGNEINLGDSVITFRGEAGELIGWWELK